VFEHLIEFRSGILGSCILVAGVHPGICTECRPRPAVTGAPHVGITQYAAALADWRLAHREVTAVSMAPAEVELPETEQEAVLDSPWVTIVWNDPINLMSYVTYVFQTVFGYAKPKAEKLMLDVHHKGRAVVSSGAREAMERDAETLHGYGLWATISHDS
jgi:ATP-dependent Clp protease adaptor protein ClpS